MGNHDTIASLVDTYDNLGEPVPLSNKPETVLGVTISLQILAWVCGLLRLWTRLRVIRAPGWDDLVVVFALLSTTLGTVSVGLGVTRYGLGKHFILLGSMQAMKDYLKIFYVMNGSYMMSTSLIKLALLLQYLRVFDRGSFVHRFTFGVAVVVALWGLSFNIVAWFPCSPAISEYWSLKPDVNCWGFASQDPTTFQNTFTGHTATNMLLDLVVLSIPISLCFRPGVQSKTRWGLSGLLLLGAVANFASIWRLATIVEHRSATWPTFDPTWYGCVSILLAAVEVDMAVVCASVPVFWPVLQSTGVQIFITKEVQVTSENRLRSVDSSAGAIELEYGGGAGQDTLDRVPSLRSNKDSLHKAASRGHGRNDSSLGYRKDTYELGDEVEHTPGTEWKRPGTQVSVSANNGGTS